MQFNRKTTNIESIECSNLDTTEFLLSAANKVITPQVHASKQQENRNSHSLPHMGWTSPAAVGDCINIGEERAKIRSRTNLSSIC